MCMYVLYGPILYIRTYCYAERTLQYPYIHTLILYGTHMYICTYFMLLYSTYTCVHSHRTVHISMYVRTYCTTHMRISPGEPVRDATDMECPLNTQSGPTPADWGRSTFTLHPYTLESLELAYIQLGPCTPETCEESTELARVPVSKACHIRSVSYICS